MRRILFVDEEPKALDALQTLSRPQRGQWDMTFAPGGEAALAFLEAAPFDVVVTNLCSAGVNGTRLLSRLRERFPEVVRIALAERMESSLQAIPVAHQFLAKPCDLADLRVAVERSCRHKYLLDDQVIRRTVGGLGELPSIPKVYQELTQAVGNPDVSLHEIGRIVERDVAISARVLQLVNSAFFGTLRPIATVHTAVSYLGLNVIKNLVLSVEVFRVFEIARRIEGFSLEALQSHAQLTARIAARLPLAMHMADVAVVAALLHDVGKLVLAWKMPGRFARFLALARQENRPLSQVEEELCGASHAEIGAYLLGLWGLPYCVTEAIAHHHAPSRVPHVQFDALGAVYVANLLAHLQDAVPPGEVAQAHAAIDVHYLQDLGIAEQLPSWQAMAAQQAHLHAPRA